VLPALTIFRAWTQEDADDFRQAAVHVITAEVGLLEWTNVRAAIIRRQAIRQNQPTSSYENYIQEPPNTLIGRALWMGQGRIEANTFELLDGEWQQLVRLLWLEVAATAMGPAPATRAVFLLDLALKYPEIFLNLVFRVQEAPQLLADMAFYPPTSALACLWVAQWQPVGNAYDRPLTQTDYENGKHIAFADTVWILGEWLKQGKADPSEVAALLEWFYANGGVGYADDPAHVDRELSALRDIIAEQTKETISAIANALEASLAVGGDDAPSTFAAALDVVHLGELENTINASPIIEQYISSIKESKWELSAHRIGASSAATLYRLVENVGEAKQAFLDPVDVRRRLAEGEVAGANPYALQDEIGRALRTHIRVLARAIAGLGDKAPDELIDALAATIHKGALSHKEKGRVSAFSAKFEASPILRPADRALSADLAMVLSVLRDARRERVFSAILETDEPLVLAQLVGLLGFKDRDALHSRIEQLTPENAGATHYHTETQARIGALLTAGEVGAAEPYIAAEANVKGKISGLDVERLRWRLRINFLRGEWDAILATPDPVALPPIEQAPARETIKFFKAIAILLRPKSDPAVAAGMFRELYKHQRQFAYASNLFAANVAAILGDGGFPVLTGAKEREARLALAEIDQMLAEARPSDPAEGDVVTLNKALLHLALNDPDRALGYLSAVQTAQRQDRVAAYRVIALSRAGRAVEARAALAEAKLTYGDSPLLRDVQAFVEIGTAVLAPVLILEDDKRAAIKSALHDLQNLPPPAQAEILSATREPFDDYVIDRVREAGAALVSLVPQLRESIDEMEEDDISAIIREVLQAQVTYLGWSVPDQSKRGYALKKPGEPDLMLMKGNTVLAVIEAVICRLPLTHQQSRDDLDNHFKKVLGYADCKLYFHLTYARIEDIPSIFAHLETMLKSPLTGFSYADHDLIPLTDSRPRGFIARYRRGAEEIKVTFLVLDVLQAAQRAVAEEARKSKPTKS